MSDQPAVSASGVTKVYGEGPTATHALAGVDVVFEQGEFAAIMGPSGSGKSTLLHIVGALEAPSSGTIEIAGDALAGMDDAELTRLRREHIGFVFQFFNLLPSLTALENVLLPALIAKDDPRRREPRARELLAQVGLSERVNHVPSEMSGGEQQRVSIARALLLGPPLILADEPTGNLDSKSGREVLGLLRAVVDEEGRTVVMVTHDAAAAAVADRVVFLRDGRIVDEVCGGSTEAVAGTYAEIADRPAGVAVG
jgi:putative ABC transport system ATP-binding protein